MLSKTADCVGAESSRLSTSLGLCLAIILSALGGPCHAAQQQAIYLGDRRIQIPLEHQQQWGDFGWNTAAAATGQQGSPLRIGEQIYARGLGHHANGQITIGLSGQYHEFRAQAGVQWQGGGKGSVVFRVEVDGKIAFESGPRSDSDVAVDICVPLDNAQQLSLIATDAGDGIGCDMANWADARLLRSAGIPFVSAATPVLDGQQDCTVSSEFCDFAVAATSTGPQVALTTTTGDCWMDVADGETAQLLIPLAQVTLPVKVLAEATIVGRGQADVRLSVNQADSDFLRLTGERAVALSASVAAPVDRAVIHVDARGFGPETCVHWSRFRLQVGDTTTEIPLSLLHSEPEFPPPNLPALRPGMEQLLIEWDWRMQDGINTTRLPQTWSTAIGRVLGQGDCLVDRLQQVAAITPAQVDKWNGLKSEYQRLVAAGHQEDAPWEQLWRETHVVRRAWRWPIHSYLPVRFYL